MSSASTSTVLDVLTAAGLYAQAIPAGEPLEAFEADLMLKTWQRLIDSSSLLSKTVFTTRIDQYQLVPGTQSYTLGTDPDTSAVGTIGAVRPNRITGVNVVLSSGVELPITYTEDDSDWREISLKSIVSLPSLVYNDGGNPLSTLFLYPIPDQAYKLNVYSQQALNQYTDLTSNVVFPPGYERWWILKLSVEVAPLFGTNPLPSVFTLMQEAEQNIRSHNSKSPRAVGEPALKSLRGLFNNRLFDARKNGV